MLLNLKLASINACYQVSTGFKIAEGPGECPICCEDSIPVSDLFIFESCSHQFCREVCIFIKHHSLYSRIVVSARVYWQ